MYIFYPPLAAQIIEVPISDKKAPTVCLSNLKKNLKNPYCLAPFLSFQWRKTVNYMSMNNQEGGIGIPPHPLKILGTDMYRYSLWGECGL